MPETFGTPCSSSSSRSGGGGGGSSGMFLFVCLFLNYFKDVRYHANHGTLTWDLIISIVRSFQLKIYNRSV